MVFDYYYRLSPAQQQVYRQSDAVAAVRLHRPRDLWPRVEGLAAALRDGRVRPAQRSGRALLQGLVTDLGVPPIRFKVAAVRPRHHWGELHGLYTARMGRQWACIQVWMRTAQRRRVVAFRTFLRTLVHEFCHHLDFEFFHLDDTFHTEGFYQRESSLVRQLLPRRRV